MCERLVRDRIFEKAIRKKLLVGLNAKLNWMRKSGGFQMTENYL